MGHSRKMWLLATMFSLLAFGTAAMAATPTVTVIDYPGAVGTAIFGINPQGDMVGAWDDTAGNEHGFVFLAPRNPAAAKTTYDTICPGGLDALKNQAAGGGCFVSFDYSTSLTTAVWTDAFGITPQGEIVGQYGAADNTTHGFLLRNGQFFPIEAEGWRNTMPAKIAPNGMIVGCNHMTGVKNMQGFVLTADGFTRDLDMGTMYNGVNPQGDILGIYYDPPQKWVVVRTFVIHEGVKTFFPLPEGSGALVGQDINASGDVVGRYKDSSGNIRGFLLRDGVFKSIDPEGSVWTSLSSINARGDIVGYYWDSNNVAHGFLLH